LRRANSRFANMLKRRSHELRSKVRYDLAANSKGERLVHVIDRVHFKDGLQAKA